MSRVHLLPVGEIAAASLASLRKGLARALGVRCEIRPEQLDPAFAFHRERGQYQSTEILAHLQGIPAGGAWRLLGVTEADLYIPILTFVFGEAQIDGPCAVVSAHRLRQEFYGLPPDPALLEERLLKESMHELGHTAGLTHCDEYRCAMSASHAVEWIDLKEPVFCSACRTRFASPVAAGGVT